MAVIVAALMGGMWFVLSDYSAGYFDKDVAKIIYKNADKDMIEVQNIPAGVTVLPSFKVFGQARGTWYFEASFPIEVVAQGGMQIAIGHAQAQGDWMTEAFVPFIASVVITKTYSGPAMLILRNDNPSGDSARDASVEIPIVIQ